MTAPATRRSTNLVPALDALVGREAALREAAEVLAADCRCLTVHGPPGIGKTRFAKALGQHLVATTPSRAVWFCDLSEAEGVGDICRAVGEALAVPLVGSNDSAHVTRLGHALSEAGAAVLILDNFEQIVGSARDTIAPWLVMHAGLSCVVTSRLRTGIDGERIIELPPLSLETRADGTSEALSLLIDRALAIGGYRPLEGDLPILQRLSEALDGIPLALELAAPRLAFLGAQGTLEELESRFELLTDRHAQGSRATLHDAIAASWGLLDEHEQRALACCSVFRGTFDLAAARAVIAPNAPFEALDLLHGLFEKSLLVSRAGERGARFQLYLSIRDFAAQRLEESGEAGPCRLRHTAYFCALGRALSRRCRTDDVRAASDELAQERDNLRAGALSHAGLDSIGCALSMGQVMLHSGPYPEYRQILDVVLGESVEDEVNGAGDPSTLRFSLFEGRIKRAEVLRRLGDLPAALEDVASVIDHLSADGAASGHAGMVGDALREKATIHLVQGDLQLALDTYGAAIEHYGQAKDPYGEACASSSMGSAYAGLGEMARASSCVEKALALHSHHGHLREEALASAFLGNLSIDSGDFGEAGLHLAHAAALQEHLHDHFGQAFTMANRALLDHRTGRLRDARPQYLDAISRFRKLGARRYAGAFEGYLALLDRLEGDPAAAKARLEHACGELKRSDDERFYALFLAYLGGLEAELGDEEGAQRHLDAASRSIERIGDDDLSLAVAVQRIPLLLAQAASLAEESPGRTALEGEAAALLKRARQAERGGRPAMMQSADLYFAIATVAPLVPAATRPVPLPTSDGLRVASDGSSFSTPERGDVHLSTKETLKRTLRALVEAYASQPHRALARDELLAAVWPDEQMRRSAGQNRIRVAISTLRKLGLQPYLSTKGSAYLLDPTQSIEVISPSAR